MLEYRKQRILLILLSLMCFFIALFYSSLSYAITALKADIATTNHSTVFYLRLSEKPENVSKFSLNNPERIVLDIKNLEWQIDNKIISKGLIDRIRFGKNRDKGRIVFDLNRKITTSTVSVNPHPNHKGLSILKLELSVNNPLPPPTLFLTPPPLVKHAKPVSTRGKFYSKHQFKPIKRRNPSEIIITIDAGHGGNDPGATSVSGFKEKNIVLSFAKEFANAINREPNMRAILTRDSDFFIPLDERPLIAGHYKSDLFISVHADALQDKTFSGCTIYTLSDTASDAISAQIAESENRSDVIAGVDFDNQLPEITDILIDFMRRETDIASYELAENLVQKLQKNTVLVPTPHRKAGFKVLKSPNIPSVLVELGFLTSIDDERRLTNPEKRRTMINNIIIAIKNWHYQRRLSGH
jgi:N-acetylmuramoyl-L-alanine amidase